VELEVVAGHDPPQRTRILGGGGGGKRRRKEEEEEEKGIVRCRGRRQEEDC